MKLFAKGRAHKLLSQIHKDAAPEIIYSFFKQSKNITGTFCFYESDIGSLEFWYDIKESENEPKD